MSLNKKKKEKRNFKKQVLLFMLLATVRLTMSFHLTIYLQLTYQNSMKQLVVTHSSDFIHE